MSIKKFENSFDNSHQRLGLALYVIIWVQVLIGFIRPKRYFIPFFFFLNHNRTSFFSELELILKY
jgi:hypothetical protein